MDKHDVIVQAVESLKKSEFKATAIKVELEASLRRRNVYPDGCSACYRGQVTCAECDGDYQGETCYDCDGEGDFYCETCEGDGHYYNDDDERVNCTECEQIGRISCTDCSGRGRSEGCEVCVEGNIACGTCPPTESKLFGNVKVCHEYLMELLAQEGLATYDDTRISRVSHGYSTHWHPVEPLVYAEFYNDGSVDSEFTFTLMLTDPKNVLLLTKFIEAFNKLAEVAGTEFNTVGAGMHMALLNEPEGKYPSGMSEADNKRARNYQKSMEHLIPALYFLGSNNETSRALNFRRPGVGIGHGTKYSTVAWRSGSLEFRVFETCYQNPEAILDNVVVMSNTMKYWRTKYKPVSLAKIGQFDFGLDNGNTVERLYVNAQHIDLLNGGLRLLKPSYYTIKELKLQRKFNRTRRWEKTRVTQAKKDAIVSYKEYENRWTWSLEMQKLQYEYDLLLDKKSDKKAIDDAAREEIQTEVTKRLSTYEKSKKSLEKYIAEKIKSLSNRAGDYRLGSA